MNDVNGVQSKYCAHANIFFFASMLSLLYIFIRLAGFHLIVKVAFWWFVLGVPWRLSPFRFGEWIFLSFSNEKKKNIFDGMEYAIASFIQKLFFLHHDFWIPAFFSVHLFSYIPEILLKQTLFSFSRSFMTYEHYFSRCPGKINEKFAYTALHTRKDYMTR